MAYAYLELADFLLIAESVLVVPAETLVRSDRVVALADSTLAAPAAAFASEEFYPELVEKAAVLSSHLVRNHPLPDGNKRTAYLCLMDTGVLPGFPKPAAPLDSFAAVSPMAAGGASFHRCHAAHPRFHSTKDKGIDVQPDPPKFLIGVHKPENRASGALQPAPTIGEPGEVGAQKGTSSGVPSTFVTRLTGTAS